MDKNIENIKNLNYGECIYNEKISKYTTNRTGGVADLIISPYDEEKLLGLIDYLKKNGIVFKILGGGSNLIFSSKRYKGVLIRLNNLNHFEIKEDKFYLEAGASIIKASMFACQNGYSGLEFSNGIPGTIGGGIYMNAGCYGSEFAKIVEKVKVLDSENNIVELNNGDCKFGYRDSIFKHEKLIVLSAILELHKGDKDEIMKELVEKRSGRLKSQPLEFPSSGSVFRNPEGTSAGKLIDDVGLKGFSIGGAEISQKHANFIVNKGSATGEDYKALIEYIEKKIKEVYNIDLVLEQELINF